MGKRPIANTDRCIFGRHSTSVRDAGALVVPAFSSKMASSLQIFCIDSDTTKDGISCIRTRL